MVKTFFKNIGPGTLVAAAFIGPGTVTVCTMAGVNHGFSLLWAMVVSIFATIVLQEMAARLGLVSGKGLAETVTQQVKHPILKYGAIFLMLSAILIGNIAYEAGNISGGVLGMQSLISKPFIGFMGIEINILSLCIGCIAFSILFIGNYKVIERTLVTMVVLMSISFIIAAILTKPAIGSIIKGLFVPVIPEKDWLTVIGLVGTTVVPYNLFLHASLVKEKWKGVSDLKTARKELYVSIIVGGLVSIAIIICGAAIQVSEINNASDLAQGLEPLFGNLATYVLSIGLFAAGITSAITAPLAAAYVVKGCFGWKQGIGSLKFRIVWMLVLGIGILFSSTGINPIEVITFAQIANGMLLPIIAVFLWWVMNKKKVLGRYRNSKLQNCMAGIIVITAIILGAKSLYTVVFG
ncbi:Nramp family divalent metal transporter [Cochleicola gelatinilyticus]|uniref:Manganese transporter n=1 Tax=Cochleicola gelatinilyticus TaxID=1763537 RepID=A0A167HNJ4_9FLAO|nr:Nramp family divalent metal transporter [Cochleicola gelatinilyticus]OAB78798.1 manganese transporter [Cochleicola gelatinilyticus]